MADGREDVLELEDEAPNVEDIDDDLDLGEEDDTDHGDAEDDEDGETVIGFEGEEEEAAPASEGDNSVIREMRQRMREKDRRIAELERANPPKRIEVGEEPSLEGCDYDEDRFKAEYDAWKGRKAEAATEEAKANERKKADEEAWATRIQTFEAGKSRLNVADFDDAEAEVQAVIPPETMAIILHCENAAEMVYALSRSPAKLKALSKLNPLEAAMMIGELRSKVQVSKRRLPEPDRALRGRPASGASADKELARLEKEADATGDRTKLVAHRKKLKSKAN